MLEFSPISDGVELTDAELAAISGGCLGGVGFYPCAVGPVAVAQPVAVVEPATAVVAAEPVVVAEPVGLGCGGFGGCGYGFGGGCGFGGCGFRHHDRKKSR